MGRFKSIALFGEIYFSSETRDIAITEAAKEKITAKTTVISTSEWTSIPKMSGERDFNRLNCVNIGVEFETNAMQVN